MLDFVSFTVTKFTMEVVSTTKGRECSQIIFPWCQPDHKIPKDNIYIPHESFQLTGTMHTYMYIHTHTYTHTHRHTWPLTEDFLMTSIHSSLSSGESTEKKYDSLVVTISVRTEHQRPADSTMYMYM